MANKETENCEKFKTMIGGQALIEGIMMRGPEKDAIVIRGKDGLTVEVSPRKLNPPGSWKNWPFIRGIFNFFDAQIVGVKALLRSADLAPDEMQEEPSKFDKWLEKKLGSEAFQKAIVGIAVAMGLLLSIGLFFLLPTLAAFIIGFVWPFLWGIFLSFHKFTTISKTTFVGLDNYLKVFQDSTFVSAFWFTAKFTVVSTVLVNVIAFAIALALTRGLKGTNVFRTVFFLPNLIGGIVLGYIWQILLNGILTNLGRPLLSLDARYGFWGSVI